MTTTTLTWASSGNCVKTGTTLAAFITNLVTLIGSKSGDAAFSWEVAGSVSTSPAYLLLRRKDGSAGRIALIYYATGPANGNIAIFDVTPAADTLWITYFPAGTGTTLSNLTAASGTMCGNDTGAVKASNGFGLGSFYGTGMVSFYFDSYDGVYFLQGNPTGALPLCVAAGALLEDSSGNAVDATFGSYYITMSGVSSGSFGGWSPTFSTAGLQAPGWRANYAGTNKQYFTAWNIVGGGWNSQLPSNGADIMSDQAANKYWYAPIPLLGQTKGEGIVLKIRQCGYGSGSTSAFATYYTTGPVAQARQMNNNVTGGVDFPWLTNFKI